MADSTPSNAAGAVAQAEQLPKEVKDTAAPTHSAPAEQQPASSTGAAVDTAATSAHAAGGPAEGGGEKKGPSKSELKKREKEAEKERKRIEREAKEAAQRAAKEAADVDYATQNYGLQPLHQSQERPGIKRTQFSTLTAAQAGESVVFRARVQNSRAQGAKMAFFTFRQPGGHTIQGLLSQKPEKVSKQMVKWAQGVMSESIVLVEGTVQAAPEPIKSCTVKDAEILISKIHTISEAPSLPFVFEDASRADAEFAREDATFARVELNTRLQARTFDLRTPANNAIFRIQHGVSKLFREFLENKDFVEIHSPKLQGAATESGASVFKVDYFKRPAFLAQSPQLSKQMVISGDFERVYEIGPVFRAEDSNTHRHLTEFTGLDLEMAIEEHYHETLDVLDNLLRFVFTELKKRYSREIEVVRQQFPSQDFTFPDKTVILSYREGLQMLKDDGVELEADADINTENEKRLGRLVKAKHGTDYYILDKFPLALRPFYTMPDAADPTLSNSYDFFMRGEEILSGAQRVHNAPLLEERMKAVGIKPEDMAEYLDCFKWAAPAHAGAGLGLERIVMFFLGLPNIRWATMFPRDPRSFKTGQQQTA